MTGLATVKDSGMPREMFLIFVCILALSVASLAKKQRGEICHFNGHYECTPLTRHTLGRIDIPPNSCAIHDCSRCLVGKASFVLTRDFKLLQPGAFILRHLENEASQVSTAYECHDNEGKTCECDMDCQGTKDFCKFRNCTQTSSCYCSLTHRKPQLLAVTEAQTFYDPDIITWDVCLFDNKATFEEHSHSRKLLEKENAEFSNNNITVKFDDPILTLPDKGRVILRNSEFEYILTVPTDLMIKIPFELLAYKTTLTIIYLHTSGKTVSGQIHISGKTVCQLRQCFLCREVFTHFRCLPKIMQYSAYCILIIFTLLLASFLKIILKSIYYIVQILGMLIYMLFKIVKIIARCSLLIGAFFGSTIRQVLLKCYGHLELHNTQHTKLTSLPLVLVACALMITVSNADCNTHAIINSDLKTCKTLQDGTKSCKLYSTSEITLQTLQSESCLWFTDKKNNQLFSMTLKLNAVTCDFNTERQYFTFPVKNNHISQVSCTFNEYCGRGVHCIKRHVGRGGINFEAETPQSRDYPGVSACIQSGAGTGCNLFRSSCAFYRTWYEPDLIHSYEVSKIRGHTCKYHISLKHEENNTISSITVTDSTFTKSGIKVTILGAYDQSHFNMDDFLIQRVGKPSESYLAKASNKNAPKAGEIGAIQANSSFTKDFIFDPEITSCDFFEDTLRCLNAPDAITQIASSQENALPLQRDIHLFKMVDEKLQSTLLLSSAVRVQLYFAGYKLSVKSQTICPKFIEEDISIKGCYKCAILARLTLVALSTCDSGVVTHELEPPKPETPKRDDPPTPVKAPNSPYPPHKSPHFLPLQNGPVQQPEPSAAVAAVTVTASTVNPATVPSSTHLGPSTNSTPLPSSTSPAGGVPFPTALLSQEEFPVSPTVVSSSSKTVSPVLTSSKSYESTVVKPHRNSGSEVVHSLPYPISSSYSDYSVSYAGQYPGKHPYQSQDNRDVSQRTHHQKSVASSNYYHQPHQQPVLDKYQNSRDVVSRNSSKLVIPCDGYKSENYIANSYDNKSAGSDLNYCVGQAYTNEKHCDPQYLYKKTASNNVYNYKTNELLNTQNSNENVIKNNSDKPKIVNESYPNVSKTKVPNRTTYYQSIVNKTHSRHKSSRRVLPASAYENSKQVINSYSSTKPDLSNSQVSKPVQYSTHPYPSETKRPDYYQTGITTSAHTASTYNYTNHKSDPQQPHLSNNNSHANWNDPAYANSRSYTKVNPEQCVSGYREKQATNTAYIPTTKAYNYQTNKSYADTRSKQSVDAALYSNSDYYQKTNVAYSRSGNTHTSVSDVYKTSSNHPNESAIYSNKNSSYHHSRTLSDKNRSYYPTQESNYKNYHTEPVPKQSTEDSHGYKVHNEINSHPNYRDSNSLKQKEVVSKHIEVPKPVAHEQITQNIVEPNHPSVQPVVCEANSYNSSSTKEKSNYYPHIDQSHYVHRRTPPPVSKSQTSTEPLKLPSKDTENFRISSTTAISSYSQRPPIASSPPPVYDSSRNLVKTLWSPTTTTATITNAPNREIITSSSRDSHSSHSNSSISSLSQLSQSLGSGAATTFQQSSKDFPREGRSSSNSHSRSSSRDETPACTASTVTTTSLTTTTTTSATTGAYGVSGSLTSLIFSKPSWTSPSVSTVLTNPSSHLTPPSTGGITSPVPSVLPLAPSLPSSHHSSPFSHHTPPAALHPAGPHVMFAPPLPTAGPLSSPSLPLATATGPAPFGDTDLLRRELDTRFLASQDRSINVPPPPYLRTEMHQHQHQHTHMHQHSPFLPPPLGGSLLPPSAAHLYDKFPKVDSSFYGRNALGLPTYPLSPLLAPGSATATPTPFAPPGHLAAFQPKISPLVKAKTMKSGRWCAMHVRISWEIYHHQQKQQAESQKSGGGSSKTVPDILRPPNHLFGSLPRPHELGFSSPLLNSATSLHGRSPYDVTPQHPSFLGPSPAHLGMTPFARPSYPGLGVPGNSFGGLGSLGLASASMLAGRELGPGYLCIGQDPWSRLHRTPPNFPSPSSMNPSSWGGLKAEAERDRIQRREEQEREKEREREREKEKEKEKMRKAEAEKRESEKSKELKEKRELEKQKERDRESRASHVSHSVEVVRNGESRERAREREWDRSRERRESSRSPLRSTHKSEAAFDTNHSGHKQDIKVKEEKKEEERNKESSNSSSSSERERTKSSEPVPQEPISDYMSRSMLPNLPMSLNATEQARLPGSLGAISQVPPPHFWNPLPPPPPQSSASAAERYRSLELQHARELDREQLMQKYASLSSVMPLTPERYREAELARHLSSSEAAAREVERQLQADRDRQVYERTKLPPPPLRPNDPPYVPAPGLPPTGGLFSSISNPFLNSLSNYPPRTKPGSPGGIGNGIPPPLIPCVSQGGSPVTSSTTPSPLHLKLGASSTPTVENSREHFSSKDRRDLSSHTSTEIESQSR